MFPNVSMNLYQMVRVVALLTLTALTFRCYGLLHRSWESEVV